MDKRPLLLAISEIGGYPDFTSLYEQAGYQVLTETSMRKVLKKLKKIRPAVIVAEFNYQSDFRDRTSSLESLMSVVQRAPTIKVIIFYDKEHQGQLAKLEARFAIHQKLSFPITEETLSEALHQLS